MPPPPHDYYDEKRKRFVTASGRVRTRAELRREIDGLVSHTKREAKRLAQSVYSGKITAVEFDIAMRELLKSGHIVAASVGRGGRDRMSARDWGKVGQKIKWQYGYLTKFSRKIARDILSEAASANRVQLYADALHVTFYRSFYDEMKDRPEDQPTGKDGKPLLVKLVQNSMEGCPDCKADADEGWMELDEMGELGSRECGDFCKCDLVFSDD
jgi:hypothetical protein